MRDAFAEYCELFIYFGRGGLKRLERAEFAAHHAEFCALDALRPALSVAQAERLIDLRDLLLRDLPKTTVVAREVRRRNLSQKTKPKLK